MRAAMAVLVWSSQPVPAEGFEYKDPVPLGFHNFFVLIVIVLTLIWAGRVVHKAWTVALIHRRLAENRPLALENMSIYVNDLQQLIRQHFNQILRMRRLVPPQEVPRHSLKCHLRPESLEVIGDDRLGVRFTVDSELPCVVRLYWGVSVAALENLLEQLQRDVLEASRAQSSGSRGRRSHSEASQPSALAPLLPQGPGPGPAPIGPNGGAAAGTHRESAATPSSSSASAAAAPSQPMVQAVVPPARVELAEGISTFWDPLPLTEGCSRSSPSQLPAGLGLQCGTLPGELLDPAQLSFDLTPSWPPVNRASTLVPLVITVTTRRRQKEGGQQEDSHVGHTQVTLLRFRRRAAGGAGRGVGSVASLGGRSLGVEVLQQLALGGPSGACKVLGVFGFEDEEGGDTECMVCYDQPRSVVLLPCRHCSVCPSCLRSLRDEQCPLCRSPFTSYLLFPLLQTA